MKITVVNNSDSVGGAAVACNRLFNAIKETGTDIRMLVEEKRTNDAKIFSVSNSDYKKRIAFIRFAIEYIYFNKIVKSPSAESIFSPAWLGIDITKKKEIKEADIINLHWINNSFLNLNSLHKLLKLNKPIVWHLHDMWAFTGGCHYSGACDRFIHHCGNCPFLKKSNKNDLSKKMWEKKSAYYENANLTIITPSKWLAELAKQSSLLKAFTIHVIPNPIDTNIFKPMNKNEAKQKLGLDIDKKYLLFASMNTEHKRKGFDYLKKALSLLDNKNLLTQNIELLVVGKYDEKIKSEFNFKINQMGVITDEKKMIAVYNAAEAFLIPSLADNLPNTAMESMACGTPVVGFKTGGIPDMIDHFKNGYLAEYASAQSLAEGISWLLTQDDSNTLALHAREKIASNYNYELIARKYTELYTNLIMRKL